MKTAIIKREKRVAPLFEVAKSCLILDIRDYKVVGSYELNLLGYSETNKINALLDAQVRVVVCGAISKNNESSLVLNGIDVYSFVSGDLVEVIQNIISGFPIDPKYKMPGCRFNRHCPAKKKRHRRWKN